jgi:hypothetical protein
MMLRWYIQGRDAVEPPKSKFVVIPAALTTRRDRDEAVIAGPSGPAAAADHWINTHFIVRIDYRRERKYEAPEKFEGEYFIHTMGIRTADGEDIVISANIFPGSEGLSEQAEKIREIAEAIGADDPMAKLI